MVESIIKIIATTPAAIAIAGGILFLAFGSAFTGWNLVILGTILQILWLIK